MSAARLTMIRTIRPKMICDVARAESALRRHALPLDQAFAGGAQSSRLAERCLIDPLHILLVAELGGTLDNDPIVPGQGGELAV